MNGPRVGRMPTSRCGRLGDQLNKTAPALRQQRYPGPNPQSGGLW